MEKPFLPFPFLSCLRLTSLTLPLITVTFLFLSFSSVCSSPRAVFAHVPYVLSLHNIQAVCLVWQLWDSQRECLGSYRAVLALHAGAVEAQGRHTVADALHMHHALVTSLARLWLGKVSGPQGDGSDFAGWNKDFSRVKELRTVLCK